jgi:hypothetical protein
LGFKRISGRPEILFLFCPHMNFRILFTFLLLSVLWLSGCKEDEPGELQLQRVFVGTIEINLEGAITTDLPVDRSITLIFSSPIKASNASSSIELLDNGLPVSTTINTSENSVTIFPTDALNTGTIYTIHVSEELRGAGGQQFAGLEVMFKTALEAIQITSLSIGGQLIEGNNRIMNIPLDLLIVINFSNPVEPSLFQSAVKLTGTNVPAFTAILSNNNQTGTITAAVPLKDFRKYTLTIQSTLKGVQSEGFSEYSKTFYTGASSTPKFPLISDDELLTKVQQQTFKFFYDYAEPNSGMARERNGSNELVTTGGTGFGLMAMVVAIERNFITRQQGINRLNKIVSFLETADRFHGAWPHWVNGNTGKVIPFSTKDNGGDLVETSFLVQGLLTFRQYLEPTDTVGNNLIKRITKLYNEVEWDWYRKDNSNVLYWHWSPNYNWEMNFAMYGYFEEQITYVLAAASPTHSIPKIVYSNGFGQNGAIVKNNIYYGYTLPLGGLAPLFWTQYSYLGLDPHFSDDYANYWTQNKNASLINQAYCIANPKQFVGYSADCWGLTSSDNQNGYNAHSPTNDLGVITPTAALSAFPYTSDESMKALKFFYYTLGDRLWGEYGFYDAFNITEDWTASSYLAIDQGPIIVMIENHRTGLLWDLFMSCPEMETAKTKLGLVY